MSYYKILFKKLLIQISYLYSQKKFLLKKSYYIFFTIALGKKSIIYFLMKEVLLNLYNTFSLNSKRKKILPFILLIRELRITSIIKQFMI